jgi:hypothetical protein
MEEVRKIFVSYKYKDWDVLPILEYTPTEDTGYVHTARHYVDKIIDTLMVEHIYKGELGDESMGDFTDDTIDSKLKEKIFDSSVTIILISPNMFDRTKQEKDQWIPNEISYSLRYKTRGDRTSRPNAMIAVVLPDRNGHYDYAVTHKNCVTTWKTETYFNILDANMFNRKDKNQHICNECGAYHHFGNDHSYIYPVKWSDFICNHNYYIDHVSYLRENQDLFDLKKIHD